MDFLLWLNEAVSDQKQRVIDKLKSIFIMSDENQIELFFSDIEKIENEIISDEDKRKSYTVWKFLNTLNYVPNESSAHTRDRIRFGLQDFVNKANRKDPNSRMNQIFKEIKRKLPNEPDNIINSLSQIVVKTNKSLDKVIEDFKKESNIKKDFDVVLKKGDLEVIEVTHFQSGDKLEKHIDRDLKMPCHILFQGTKWCVRFNDYFMNYVGDHNISKKVPLYLIRKNGKPYALGNENNYFKDVNDNNVSDSLMKEIAPIVVEIDNLNVSSQGIPFLEDTMGYLKKMPLGRFEDVSYTLFGQLLKIDDETNDFIIEEFLSYYYLIKEHNWLPDINKYMERKTFDTQAEDLIREMDAKTINALEEYLDNETENINEEDQLWQKLENNIHVFSALQDIFLTLLQSGTYEKNIHEIIDTLGEKSNYQPLYFKYNKDDESFKMMFDSKKALAIATQDMKQDEFGNRIIESKEFEDSLIKLNKQFKYHEFAEFIDKKQFNKEVMNFIKGNK